MTYSNVTTLISVMSKLISDQYGCKCEMTVTARGGDDIDKIIRPPVESTGGDTISE